MSLYDRWAEEQYDESIVLTHPDGRKIWVENGKGFIQWPDGRIEEIKPKEK